MHDLDDPFLVEKLNPLLLETLQNYWNLVGKAQDVSQLDIINAQKILLRFAFHRLFLTAYLKFPLQIKGTVYFLANVLPDGLGDYYAALKSARALQKEYPSIDVHLAYVRRLPLPGIDPKDYLLSLNNIHDFFETSNRPILGPILEGQTTLPYEMQIEMLKQEKDQVIKNYEDIKKTQNYAVPSLEGLIADYSSQIEHLQKFATHKSKAEELCKDLKHALAIVHIALAINTFDNPQLAPKSLYFAEAGNFQGIANYLRHNWFSMGLEPFDEGIFLEKTFPETTAWKNNTLNAYATQGNLFTGYLTTIPLQRLVFIYLVCLMQKEKHQMIQILLPQGSLRDLPSLNARWLANKGIAKVEMLENESLHTLLLTEIEKGKTLRFIPILPLPPSDFEKIISLSGPVVGCTGDGSLSDCLISKKVPFYEMRRHKKEAWAAFQNLAEKLDLDIVSAYLRASVNTSLQDSETAAENLYGLVTKNGFSEQWNQLLKFISKYYCFENSLKAHLARHLWIFKEKSLISFEETLVQAYKEGKISAEQAFEGLAKKLKRQ